MNTKYKDFLKILEKKEDDLSPLMEGIDIDIKNKVVSFNKKHENHVDTSDIINPTYSKVMGYNVISIFKRKNDTDLISDGNPLIYALKGINGWVFKNCKQDIEGLLKQFIKITGKIQNHYDTIVTIPSSNTLNTEFLHRLNNIIKCENIIENYFKKLKAADVYTNYDKKTKHFYYSYCKIYSVLKSEFGLNNQKINDLIQGMVDEHLKLGVVIPLQQQQSLNRLVDEHLKLGVVIPVALVDLMTDRWMNT